jgi:hypothetical protein
MAPQRRPPFLPGTRAVTTRIKAMNRKKPQKRTRVRSGRRTANRPRPGPDELARIALDLFAERHFASVTIKDIGRAANVKLRQSCCSSI